MGGGCALAALAVVGSEEVAGVAVGVFAAASRAVDTRDAAVVAASLVAGVAAAVAAGTVADAPAAALGVVVVEPGPARAKVQPGSDVGIG